MKSNGRKTVNGVTMYEYQDGEGRHAVTYYSDDPNSIVGAFSFKQYISNANTVVLTGDAYGDEAIKKARRMFPNMEFTNIATGHDGDTGDIEHVAFRVER